MKTLIVYYSLEGNTKYAAEQAAAFLNAELLELVPVKAYPSGKISKFFWGGKSAVMAEKPDLQPYTFDPSAYDRIIFGSPVWASNVAPPLRTFIRDNDLHEKRIAAIACQGGNGAQKAFAKLKDALGIAEFEAELILIDPKARPCEENTQKLRAFCKKLQQTEV